MKKWLILLACVALTGCTEQEKRPAGYDGLEHDKLQNNMLNKHEAVIHGVTIVKDEKSTYQPGLIAFFKNLDARMRVLEAVDPNALEPRIKALEDKQSVQDAVDTAWIKGIEGSVNQDIKDEHGCIIGQTLAAPLCEGDRKKYAE